MTTIAYKDGKLAADTMMIKGTTILGHVTKIVRREDGALCGGSGNLGWVQAFHRWFLAADEDVEPPPLSEYDTGIIVRKGNPEIEIFENGSSFHFEPAYTAIGSGSEFALAVMSVGADAETAVRTAMMFDPGTGGIVEVVEHGEPDLVEV
jgi:20S proteasome alpha/beta subunit